MLKLPRFTKRTKATPRATLANLEPEEVGPPPVCDVWTVENNVRNNQLTTANYLNQETINPTPTLAWTDNASDNTMLTNFQRRRHFKGEKFPELIFAAMR